jgi:hypothetical protein
MGGDFRNQVLKADIKNYVIGVPSEKGKNCTLRVFGMIN